MNEQAITSRFRAHDCAGNTAEQNKRYIVPHILQARSERYSDFLPGNILQEPQKHWNGYQWKNDSGDLVYEDFEVETEWQWASNLYRNDLSKRPGKYIWRNGYVGPVMEPFNSGMRWGCREYNVPERHFIDCDFFAMLDSHGAYISPYDNTTFERCTFIRCGAQGIQVAYRPLPFQQYQPDNRPYEKKPVHTVRDCHFIDCGETGPSRSFTASFFNPGSQEYKGTLLMENCSFVEDYTHPFGYKEWRSTGALLVSPMQGNPIMDTNMMAHVEVKNCLFDYTKGDRPIALIRSTDEVIFEDCMFIAREYGGTIDINSPNSYTGTSKSKRVILRNCKVEGDVQIRFFPEEQTSWNDFLLKMDVETEGREIVIDAETGTIISDRSLNAEVSPETVEEVKRARKVYFVKD